MTSTVELWRLWVALRRYLRRRYRSGQPHRPYEVYPNLQRQPPRLSTRVSPPRRARVLHRDGHQCTQCGAGDALTVHHVVPARAGGIGWPENLVTLCWRCHRGMHGA